MSAIYKNGGLGAFWAGTSAKLAESASKGLILMVAKEGLLNVFNSAGVSPGEKIGELHAHRHTLHTTQGA